MVSVFYSDVRPDSSLAIDKSQFITIRDLPIDEMLVLIPY